MFVVSKNYNVEKKKFVTILQIMMIKKETTLKSIWIAHVESENEDVTGKSIIYYYIFTAATLELQQQ